MFEDIANPPKGKGKEKQAPQTQYPIVLLLSLLDRESLLKTPSILESVVSLLDTVTRPLTSLKDAQQKAGEPSASVSAISAPASASATSGLAIPPGETIVLAAPENSAEAGQYTTESFARALNVYSLYLSQMPLPNHRKTPSPSQARPWRRKYYSRIRPRSHILCFVSSLIS